MRTLVLATQNAKKRKELEELARGAFLVRTLADVGLAGLVVDETGATFADNARLKADAVAAALPPFARNETFAVVADDSGIAVDALDGKPGVHSARFAADAGVLFLGDNASTPKARAALLSEGRDNADAANNALLLLLLEAVPDAMRGARFVSHVCAVVLDTGAHVVADGAVAGTVARDLRGAGGFGYDPLFCPVEAPGRRMAELTPDEKHAISHRGRAMRALLAKFVFQRAQVR